MKKILLVSSLLLSQIHAVSAYQEVLSLKQSDTKSFRGTIKGDEWFHWVEDNHGNIIKYNPKSKNYEYAKVQRAQGYLDLVPSGKKVATGIASQTEDISIIDKKILLEIWKQKRDKERARKTPQCSTKQKPSGT